MLELELFTDEPDLLSVCCDPVLVLPTFVRVVVLFTLPDVPVLFTLPVDVLFTVPVDLRLTLSVDLLLTLPDVSVLLVDIVLFL